MLSAPDLLVRWHLCSQPGFGCPFINPGGIRGSRSPLPGGGHFMSDGSPVGFTELGLQFGGPGPRPHPLLREGENAQAVTEGAEQVGPSPLPPKHSARQLPRGRLPRGPAGLTPEPKSSPREGPAL